jgi:gluconolactonase
MKKILLVFLIIFFTECTSERRNQQNEAKSFKPFIERISPEIDDIINISAKVEIIAEGFEWTEGPLWVDEVGLLFSDIPPNSIYRWTADGGTKLYLNQAGYTGVNPRGGEKGSNGLLLDNDGNLVLCQHGDRRLAKMNAPLNDPKPDFTTIIDQYEGKKFNSPNDACFSKNGDLYFTDPPYGLENRMDDPLKELSFQGVYKYTPSGELYLLTKELSRPNGIALSPDEKTLYVANSDPKKAIWMAYSLDDQGKIESEKLFHDATNLVGKEKGLPDGLKVDDNGNVFASGPGGVWIFNSEGKVLGKIRTGQATSNCAFSVNGKVLFITADMYVMKVEMKP